MNTNSNKRKIKKYHRYFYSKYYETYVLIIDKAYLERQSI